MPAIHTEDFLSSSVFHRVHLPPLDYMTVPEIRQAAEQFFRLYRQTLDHHQHGVGRAERAVRDAEKADKDALAEALLTGGTEPKARAATVKAETALADAKARQSALRSALATAYQRLHDVVVAHAPEWAAVVAAESREAQARMEKAAAEFRAAHRDLVATGGLLAMLVEDPGGLNVRPYVPAARLSLAADAISAAVADVRERGPRLPGAEPAPVEADEFEVSSETSKLRAGAF